MRHAEKTGLSEAEIRRRAAALQKEAKRRGMPMRMSDAIGYVIDAAIEHAQ